MNLCSELLQQVQKEFSPKNKQIFFRLFASWQDEKAQKYKWVFFFFVRWIFINTAFLVNELAIFSYLIPKDYVTHQSHFCVYETKDNVWIHPL